ncbi:MAG: DUF2066 domain-containing protein [Thiohalomonadaceae bacterium]
MKRTYFYLWALFFWHLTGAVAAVEVHDLYEAEVGVADQQTETRQQAMRLGLAEILQRVTGGVTVPESELAELLNDAPRYIQQYRYQANQTTPTLWMAFDADSLNKSLRALGLPIWGHDRPVLLVWLAYEDGNERRLVSAAERTDWSVLEQTARQRGLPLRWPLLDLEDQAGITATDVWGGFWETVTNASARYQPQAILLGRLYEDRQKIWRVRWTLQIAEEVLYWDNSSAVLDEVLAAGVTGSADALAVRFSQVASQGSEQQLTLSINEVHSLADYVRLMSYLRSLNGVSDVQISKVEPTVMHCRLLLKLSPDAIARTIGLGTTLAAMPAGNQGSELTSFARQYRLLP